MLLAVATFDKKKSVLNVSIAIVTKIVLLAMSFWVRRCLIVYGSASLGGLAALYGDIVGLLSIVECSVSSVFLFHMYEPIVKGDTAQVSALYHACRKVCYLISGLTFGLGLLLLPLLPVIANLAGDLTDNVNLYVTFLLFLATTCIGYLFRAPVTIVDAHKNNFVNTSLQGVSVFVGQVLQIVALVVWQSFTWYLVAAIVNVLINWLLLTLYIRRHYGDLIATKASMTPAVKQAVKRNVKAMAIHNTSAIIAGYFDNLIILLMLGFVTRNAYANYIMILESLTKLIQLCLSPLTAIIGHHCVAAAADEKHRYFQFFYTVNLIVNVIFMLGYFAVINPLINLWFGSDLANSESLLLGTATVMMLVINNFTVFIRQPLLLYRDTTGNFYYDRWCALATMVWIMVLAPLMTWWLGIFGTVLTIFLGALVIYGLVEPLLIYRRMFARSPVKYCLTNYGLVALFAVTVGGLQALLSYVIPVFSNLWLQFLVNGCVAVAVAGTVLLLLLAVSPTFRRNVGRGWRALFPCRKAVVA